MSANSGTESMNASRQRSIQLVYELIIRRSTEGKNTRRADVCKSLSCSESVAKSYLGQLASDGLIVNRGRGLNTVWMLNESDSLDEDERHGEIERIELSRGTTMVCFNADWKAVRALSNCARPNRHGNHLNNIYA